MGVWKCNHLQIGLKVKFLSSTHFPTPSAFLLGKHQRGRNPWLSFFQPFLYSPIALPALTWEPTPATRGARVWWEAGVPAEDPPARSRLLPLPHSFLPFCAQCRTQPRFASPRRASACFLEDFPPSSRPLQLVCQAAGCQLCSRGSLQRGPRCLNPSARSALVSKQVGPQP